MSSKMITLNPQKVESQTTNALLALQNQRDADRKFALQMKREDRRDALAQARFNLENKRYNDALARAEREKDSKLAGLLAAGSLEFDVPTTETVSVKDLDKTKIKYDEGLKDEKIMENMASIPILERIANTDTSEVKPFSTSISKKDLLMSKEDRALLAENEKIQQIKDPLKRRRAELELAKKYAGVPQPTGNLALDYRKKELYDQENPVPGKATRFGNQIAKTFGHGMRSTIELGNPIADIFRSDEEQLIADEENAAARKQVDERWATGKGPLDAYRTKISTLQDKRKEVSNILKSDAKQRAEIDKVLKSHETKVWDGSMKDEVATSNRSAYMKRSNLAYSKAQDKINSDTKLDRDAKLVALAQLQKRKQDADAAHAAELTAEIKNTQKLLEIAAKNQNKIEQIKLKAKLDRLNKVAIENAKEKLKSTQTKIKLDQAKTKKTLKEAEED